MSKKPTYEELEQRVKELEGEQQRRNETEKALLENKQRYERLVNTIPCALYDYIRLPDGRTRFIYISSQCKNILGYDADSIVENPDLLWNMVHMDDLERLKREDRTANQTGGLFQSEVRIVQSTDRIKWIQLTSRPSAQQVDSQFIWSGVILDITDRKRAEEALKESEKKYRAYFNLPQVGIAITSPDKGWIEANQALCDLLGFGWEELRSLTWSELTYPDDLETDLPLFQRVMQGEIDNYAMDKRFVRKDGGIVWVALSVHCIRNDDGGVECFIAHLNDITDRKEAEKAVKRSESMQKKMVANIGDVIVNIDQDGINKYKSPNIEKLFGWKPEDVVGASTWENVHPEDLESAQNFFRALIREPNAVGTTECRYKCKDGSYRWIQFTGSNLLHDSDIRGILGNYHDITERKKAEQSLRESETRFKALHNASFGGIAIHDKGIILECNQGLSEITGYSVTELIGMDGLMLIAEKSRNTVMNNIVTSYEKPYEATGLRKNGEEFPLRIEARNIPYKGKNVRTVEFRDITEQKKIEEQLRQTQKMDTIGTLAGGIAHDFNNILFPIIGYSEMLLEDAPEDSSQRASLNEINIAALRARDLVKQILTFSRQDSVEVKLIKIQPIIKEALKLVRSTIPTSISIKQYIQTDPIIIKADPTQIHQILMNLATNAFHAMEDTGGVLKVDLREIEFGEKDVLSPGMESGPYVCLAVADTGIGMDEDLIDKIFDPFFSTKEHGKGTGMGLSVVHGIVQGTGGGIQVNSKLGEGTEFCVYLPVVKNSSDKKETQPKEPILTGTERILLVDDEEAIVFMEKQMLERLGYQVVSRTSSVEALEAFLAYPDKFDVVITDMAMPNMSGHQLASELIKIRPDIPVLLCTGFSENMTEEKAASLGIKDFLMKPIVMQDLSKKVREVLDNRV